MSYLDEIVKESIINNIPEKEKNRMVFNQIEDKMRHTSVQRAIDEAITNQVNKAVKQYIDEHPEAFNEIDMVVTKEFEKELNNYGMIKGAVKKFISKATWRFYIDRYLY